MDGRFLEIHPEQRCDREYQQGSQFAADSKKHADIRAAHHESDIQQGADADEDQTRDESVAECKRVDRLEPVHLHQRHELVVAGDC